MAKRRLRRLSGVKIPGFHDSLVSLNHIPIQQFSEWAFYPGMLFGAKGKWWGDKGERDTPHEGLDICFYKTGREKLLPVVPGTLIPSAFDGLVVKVSPDFLGESVFIRHDGIAEGQARLMTIFGHTSPVEGLGAGSHVARGEVIGSVARPRPGQKVPPHLHVSIAWVNEAATDTELDWARIAGSKNVTLIDPLTVLSLPHSVLDR
jgi:murein DD-endopeptidase MepM/ murein hydrolase activator NlpD